MINLLTHFLLVTAVAAGDVSPGDRDPGDAKRRHAIHQFAPAQRARLQMLYSKFLDLPPEKQLEMLELSQELAPETRVRLRLTHQKWQQFLRSLPVSQRETLLEMPPQDRMEKVKEIQLTRQRDQLLDDLRVRAPQRNVEELRRQFAELSLPKQIEKLSLEMMRTKRPPPHLPEPPAQVLRDFWRDELEPETRQTLMTMAPEEQQLRLVALWHRQRRGAVAWRPQQRVRDDIHRFMRTFSPERRVQLERLIPAQRWPVIANEFGRWRHARERWFQFLRSLSTPGPAAAK